MFESHYVGIFFRLWGTKESPKVNPEHSLLANSQNEFDAKIGDVVGKISHRFFIIEFKTTRQGIAAETEPGGAKPHRAELYDHLLKDSTCRDLANVGHFSAYPDTTKQLAFECYIQAASPAVLNPKIPVLDFSKFYSSVTEKDLTLSASNAGYFTKGLGWTGDQFKQYVDCMYRHLHYVADDEGQMVLGMFEPHTGKFITFHGTVPDLISKLTQVFSAMTEHLKKTNPNSSFGKP